MQNTTEHQLMPQVENYLRSVGYEYMEMGFRHIESNQAPSYVDILVFDGRHKPYIVVEVKKELPENLTKFHPAVDEAYSYARQLQAPFFLVTDAVTFFWYKVDKDQLAFNLITAPPQYKRTEELPLQALDPDKTIKILFSSMDILRGEVSTGSYIEILFALLITKIFDEQHASDNHALRFRTFQGEHPEKTKARISKLYQTAIKARGLPLYENMFEEVKPALMQGLVKQLEYLKVSDSDFVEKLIEETYRVSKDSGVFVTPPPIRNLIGELFDVLPSSTVLDPALGTAGFIASIVRNVRDNRKRTFPRFVGVEINEKTAIVAASRVGALGIAEQSKIILGDFLNNLTQKKLKQLHKSGFDFVVANPPFGRKSNRTEPYELLFLYAIVDQLKLGGYAAVILPEGLLANSSSRQYREDLVSKAKIVAVISLPAQAFHPYTAIKASIVILGKTKKVTTNDNPTLFLRIPNKENPDEMYSLAAETFRYFVKTKRILRNKSVQLSPVISQIDPQNGYRLDYSAYAIEYLQLIERLRKSGAKIVSLGEVCDVRLGRRLNEILSNEIPVLSLNDLRSDWFFSNQVENSNTHMDLFGYEDVRLKPGDLILPSILSPNNPVILVPETNKVAMAHHTLLVIRPNQDKLIPSYLFALLQHKIVQIQLDALSIGSTIRSATPRLLKEIQIPLLPLAKQKEIGEHILRSQEAQILAKTLLQRAAKSLTALFDTENEEADNETS